jgi:hypothetical protein
MILNPADVLNPVFNALDVRRDISADVRRIFGRLKNLIRLRVTRAPCDNSWHGLCARIQNSIMCRRSSRQGKTLRCATSSTIDPSPGSGSFAFMISRRRGFSHHFHLLGIASTLLNLSELFRSNQFP